MHSAILAMRAATPLRALADLHTPSIAAESPTLPPAAAQLCHHRCRLELDSGYQRNECLNLIASNQQRARLVAHLGAASPAPRRDLSQKQRV